MKSIVKLHVLRPWIQAFFFVLFLALFMRLSYPFTKHFYDNIFLAFDPLVTSLMIITGSFITAAIIGSAVMIILTIIFGRFFCGYVCPMGSVLDFSARAFPEAKPKKPFGKGRFKNIKYYFLVFLFAGSLLGFTAFLFFDPLVFLYRVFTLNVYPFAVIVGNFGADLIRPLALKMGMYTLAMVSFEQPVFAFGLASLTMFLVVIVLIAVERRFWCRNLCPLGALFSVFSRFSLVKRRVSDSCIGCGRCARICPMNAIGDDFTGTSSRECIQCERCAAVCPVDAITFGPASPSESIEFNPSRRGMCFTAIGGVLAGMSASSAVSTEIRRGKLIRPPGALVENDFLDACIRCGKCMKVCPTHALQPAGLQAGFEGMFTPVLTPRIGACEEQCNLCGQVCPTGAIRSLTLEEKKFAVMGNATIERNRCIAWEQGKVCLICDEVCPYDAVEFHVVVDQVGAIKRPFVIEEKCVGCGQCENGCPVNGPSAINVTPINEERKNEGSYITEEKRRLRDVEDDTQDFSKELGTYDKSPPSSPDTIPAGGDTFENDVPEGFQMPEEIPEGFVR